MEEAITLLGMKLAPTEDDTLTDQDKYDRREDFFKGVNPGYWPALVECYYKTLDNEGKIAKFIQTNFEILREFALGSLSETRFMKSSEEDTRLKEFLDSMYVIAISYNNMEGDNNAVN